MFYLYILRSRKDGRFYTGVTKDLKDRIKRHDENRSLSTKNRGPYDLVYYEIYDSRSDAMKRERYLKSLEGGPMKKVLVEEFDQEKLIALQ